MERAEIKAIIKEILNEEYQGWKAPVLPGNALEGDILVAKEDFIDPPLDITNKVEWKTPVEGQEPTPGEDYVKSVNSKTPDDSGDVELKASDIKANNTQSIQANLERIDEAVEQNIDDIADLNTNKQHKLIAGSNITITPGEDGDTISASGGGGGGSVEKVNNIGPDASGNVELDGSDIPYSPGVNLSAKIDSVVSNVNSIDDRVETLEDSMAELDTEDLTFTLADDTEVTLKVVIKEA